MDSPSYKERYERFDVLEEMATRIAAVLSGKDAEIGWHDMRCKLQSDYSREIKALYGQSRCEADGADLIADATEKSR